MRLTKKRINLMSDILGLSYKGKTETGFYVFENRFSGKVLNFALVEDIETYFQSKVENNIKIIF